MTDSEREHQTMLIQFERSGGFTGMPITLTLDTETLSAQQLAQFNALMQQADFFNLPETTATLGQPDRFHYQITMQTRDRQHTVRVREADVSDTLKPLLDWLLAIAQEH